MCKLFAIVEIENQKNAEKFAKAAVPYVTKTDNHGLGIMRLGENGVHIQRWLEPPVIVRKKRSAHLAKYERALLHQENEEGRRSRNLYALAIHGRFATCLRSIENTHPFYKNGAALMHNGVISNPLLFTRELSTCDSEALLSQYLEHGVDVDNRRLTDALEDVRGYYAAIVFNDNGIIDIWRDDTADLFLAHVKGVGIVIATTAEIILQTAKRCRAYVSGVDEILPGTVIRWDKGLSPQLGKFESPEVPASIIKLSAAEPTGAEAAENVLEHWWNKEGALDGHYLDTMAEEDAADLAALQRLQGKKGGAQ